MKKLLISLFIVILLIGLASATKYTAINSFMNYTFDNVANFGQDSGMAAINANWTASAGGFTNGTGNLACIDKNCGNTTIDGTYGTTAAPNSLNTSAGLSLWIRTNDVTTYQDIEQSLGTGTTIPGSEIYIQTGNFLWLQDGGGSETTLTTSITAGAWTHYFFRVNSTGTAIFINGVAVTSNNNAGKGFFRDASTHYLFGSNTHPLVANTTFDEVKFYNVSLTDAQILTLYQTEVPGGGIGTATINTTLISPINNSALVTISQIFNASGTLTGQINFTNTTLNIWFINGTLFNTTTKPLSGTSVQANSTTWNITSFIFGSYIWNANICSKNSSNVYCAIAPNNFTFSYGLTNNSDTYNSSTYETASESFMSNFTLTNGYNITSAILIWNGTMYSANYRNDGTSSIAYYNNLMIPASIGTKNIYWNLIINNNLLFSTPFRTQVVNAINLTLCNLSPNNVTYLNFTFVNETILSENVTASISSTFIYWLGDGSVNKTYSFATSNLNSSYAFCFTPSNQSVNILPNLQYSNPYSIQRNYAPSLSSYAATALTKPLYLLPTALGIYSRYVTQWVQTIGTSVLTGVSVAITRSLNGQTINIGNGITDSSGLFAIYLDPTATYSYVFSKSGFNTNSFSLTPNNVDIYSISMTSTTSSSGYLVNGTSIANNLSTIITPSNSTLINNTIYNFGLNATGIGITFISLNITNGSGVQVGYASGTNGLISVNINTGKNSTFIGSYIIQTSSETYAFTHTWRIGDYYVGTYSLFRLMKEWPLYTFAYDYYRIIIMLLVLLSVMGGLSAIEITDTNESKIGAGIMILWIFSYVGWLTMNISIISPTSSFFIINHYANQYGLAILATIGGLFSLKEYFS